MHAYELLPRLKHLTLVGRDDEGNLEFLGDMKHWQMVAKEENKFYGT